MLLDFRKDRSCSGRVQWTATRKNGKRYRKCGWLTQKAEKDSQK